MISAGWANNAACVGSAVRIGWLRCSYVALRMGYRLASLGLERRLGAYGSRDEKPGRFHAP